MKVKNLEIKKFFRVIEIMFIFTIIILMIPYYIFEVENDLISNLPSNIFLVVLYFVVWLVSKFFSFITNYFYFFIILFIVWLFGRIFIIYNSEKMYFKEKKDKSDINDESYYRDIIINYSPAVLSYINDFELDIKDVVATLMSLELKNKIKFNKHIEIIDENSDNLFLNEKYVLEHINENNMLEIDMKKFQELVIEDCLNSELLSKKKNFADTMVNRGLIYFIFIIICIDAFNYVTNGTLLKILSLFVIFGPFIPILYFISMYFYMDMYSKDPYIRNKKSKSINNKINGLKRFIDDFSNLDEREYEHINLWREYLIYSVIVGDNKKIIDQMRKFIKL